jgi:hypothetical protein
MTKTTSSRIEELGRVWTPEAKWTIPQASGEPAFLFPAFGPGTYDNVVKQVIENRESGVNLPRGEQSTFLLDEAYNSDDEAIKKSPRSEFVRKNIMYDGWLWIHSVNVWTPKDVKNPGMYSVFDENGEGLERVYTTEELEDRLSGGDTERGVRFSQDRTVAFVPQNTIKSGEHNKGTLSQDGAFIAVYSPEGAEALDRVAEQFRFEPYSWIVNNDSDKPIQSLSALGGDVDDGRLVAGFGSGGGSRDGYVISVSGSDSVAKGGAPKK